MKNTDGADTESKTTRVSPNLSFKLTNWVICLNKANVMKFHALLNLQLIASWSGPHLHSKSYRFTSVISMIFCHFFYFLVLPSSHVEYENSYVTFLAHRFLLSSVWNLKQVQSLAYGRVTFFSHCLLEIGILRSGELVLSAVTRRFMAEMK